MKEDLELPRRRILAALIASPQPLTGRQVATSALMSPTTATKVLQQLQEENFVTSSPDGRSRRWAATPAATDTTSGTSTAVPTRRALIVTALPLETAAVRNVLPPGAVIRESNGTRVFETTLTGSHIGWQVRVLQGGVGNVSAAAAVAQRFDNFIPDLLIFVGVAGGLKANDAHHGDVVIVTRAYNASSGKEVNVEDAGSSFLSRPVSIAVTHQLEELAQVVAASANLRSAAVSLGAVASTEAVLGHAQGDLYQRIRSHINDCSIVDMESFGVLTSARRIGVPAISVRGISDFVADKTPDADHDRQPAAARNAAKIALRFLRDAEPGDVGHGNDSKPEEHVTDAAGHAEVTVLEHESLPANAEPWHHLLQSEDADRANHARLALLKWRRGAVATHASRVVDRPPDWLRSDLSGHAWAMVAAVATSAGSGVASRAYREAARRARAAGAYEVAGLHQVYAVLADYDPAAVGRHSDAERDFLASLDELDLSSAPEADAHRAMITAQALRKDNDWAPAIDAARHGLATLGIALADEAEGEPGGSSSTSRTALPEPVRESVAAGLALNVATFYLYLEEGLLALQAADLALRLLPRSGTARLRRGQALLTLLNQGVSDTGSGPRESDTLKEIERLALEAHAILTDWDSDAAEALAVAGRARMHTGDARAALTLLLPPPDGNAAPAEAASSDVLRIVAAAATMIGDHELALRSSARLDESGEGLLLRARALENTPNMGHEARRTYHRALTARGSDRSVLERAMLGLARTGEPLHDLADAPGRFANDDSQDDAPQRPARTTELRTALDELRLLSPRMADIVTGTAALTHNDPSRALALAMAHRDHVQGIELAADAYEASGEPDKGLHLLWDFGRARGDVALMLEAMTRAVRQGDFDRVRTYSDDIIRDHAGEARRMARRARIHAAGLANDWSTVDTQAAKLLEEQDEPRGGRLTQAEALHCRWTRVEALMLLDQPRSAFNVLTSPRALSVSERNQARLALATIQRVADEGSAPGSETIDWVLEIASTWLDDEEVCRQAIGILLMNGGDPDVARVARARNVIENYFERHKDAAQIKQIKLNGTPDDDADEAPEGYFDPLIDELKRQTAGHDQAASKVQAEVVRGRVPLAMAADVFDLDYASMLIKTDLGVHVVSAAHAPARSPQGLTAAKNALKTGAVSVDTSALIICHRLGVTRRDLLGLFPSTYLAEALRADILHTRARLGKRNDTALLWDSVTQRARVDVADAADVERWAVEASELAAALPLMTVRRPGVDAAQSYGLHALALADNLAVALWADDAPMRAVAAERNVPTFSTFDLLGALHERRTPREFPSPEAVLATARDARIVDLPLTAPWSVSAQGDGWNPNGGTAVAISRAAAWDNRGAAFNDFRQLIDTLVRERRDTESTELVARWTFAAAHGLVGATEPGARASMTANLLSWVLFQYEPALDVSRIVAESLSVGTPALDRAVLLQAMYQIMHELGEVHFAGADGVRQLTTTLAAAVRSVADAQTTMRLMLSALNLLTDDEMRQQAVKALLSFPPVPDPDDPT